MELIIALLVIMPWFLLIFAFTYLIKAIKKAKIFTKDIKEYEESVLSFGPDCLEAVKLRNQYKGNKKFERCMDYINKMWGIKSLIEKIGDIK